MAYATLEKLYQAILNRLAQPGYATTYADESAFEADVWARLLELLGPAAAQHCLTSHTQRTGRSAAAFEAFCKESRGPDVRVLGSNNRLDIVVKHQQIGSVGIEVKWLGKRSHTKKLTQGLGQARLALENRDRTLLMIHCRTVTSDDRSFNVLRTGSAWARRQRSLSCRSGGTILPGGITAFASVFLAHRSPRQRWDNQLTVPRLSPALTGTNQQFVAPLICTIRACLRRITKHCATYGECYLICRLAPQPPTAAARPVTH